MLGGRAKLYFAFSLVFLITAIVLATWGFPKIVSKQIQKNVQIENSSAMFEKWRKMPMPLTFKIYVFNVTNVENVNMGEKPKLTEIGPFVYKQYRERTILGYGNNDTVKYMLKKTFYFDQEQSGNLTEDDIVTVINFPYMAAILSVHSMMPSMVTMINEGLQLFFPNLNDAFMTVKIKDLFFGGIYLNCAGNHSALGLVCTTIKAKPPPNMRLSEDGNGVYFSMFNYMNDTEFGPYEMVRGRDNIKELGHIVSYKGQTAMSNWGDAYCNMLNGSDSSIFPPMDGEPPQRIYTFEPDICRSLYASLVGAKQLFNLSTYYYEISESALASKSANPNNKCFCRNNWSKKHDGCLVMGVLNLMPCQGAPAIASLPHFYLASEELLEYFESGIRPDKEKHNTYVYLEPITGVVLKGVKRLQFNVELRAMEGVPQLENVMTGLFPLLWIEEGAEIPESLLEELKHSHTLLSYVETARWLILAIAVAVAIMCAVAVAKTGVGSLPLWPRNSVTFIHKPGSSLDLNKQ